MNAIFKMLLYLAMVIFLVAIAYANVDQRVNVTYFPNRRVEDVPVFLVILGSVFIGVLAAGVIAVFEHFKHGMREREAQRRIDALESEVRELRSLSIGDGLAQSSDDDADWAEE
ncbi:MAG: LapA family protein [Acidobacteria bacterium]|nr:LapA family protein [Acidobacteriota bacterium]